MYQIGCENVRDHDETTISKTAVELSRTDQKPAANRQLCCLYPQYLSVSFTL
jgi:RNA-binding protein YlmH